MSRLVALLAIVGLLSASLASGGLAAPAGRKPDVAGKTLAGKRLSLKQLRGKWVLVNAWASWCGPCNDEAAEYAEFVRSNPSLRYVGLNVADTPSGARAFVKRYRWTWPSIVDRNRGLEARLGVTYQPVVVVIDPKGEVAGVHAGPGDADIWGELVEKAQART